MESDLHKQFLEELERKYGPRNLLTSKFGTSSYGVIAKDLCISASQFSKLISGTATEGMYMRSIANIAQLLKIDRLEAEKLKHEVSVDFPGCFIVKDQIEPAPEAEPQR